MTYTSYFEPYKIYHDNLEPNTSIVGISSSLVSDCNSKGNTIKSTYFDKIRECKWKELGKNIVTSNIIGTLSSRINKTNNFIENSLAQACKLSINVLLPVVKEIKTEDEILKDLVEQYDQTEKALNMYNLMLRDEPPTLPRFVRKDKKTGKNIYEDEINGEYVRLCKLVDDCNRKLRTLEMQITFQKSKLTKLCGEANNIIATILALNGTLSQLEINSMLPKYEVVVANISDYGNPSTLNDQNINGENGNQVTENKASNRKIGEVEIEKAGGGVRLLVPIGDKILPIWKQSTCDSISISSNKVNIKLSGCSILAATSALSYVSGNLDITIANTASAMGAMQWSGISHLFGVPGTGSGIPSIEEDVVERRKGSVITIKNRDYQIYATASVSKLNPRVGSYEQFENFVKDVTSNGGSVIMGIAKALNKKGYTYDDLKNQTGIKSDIGHMISLNGIDDNGYVIFSDSAFSLKNSEEAKKAYEKGLTLKDVYEYYIKGNTGMPGNEYYEYVMGIYDVDLIPIN